MDIWVLDVRQSMFERDEYSPAGINLFRSLEGLQ